MKILLRVCALLFWLLVAYFMIDFAIGNRADVFLVIRSLRLQIPMPVYAIFFLGIFVGLFFAALVTGSSRLKAFIARRAAERKVKGLENELAQRSEEAQKVSSDLARLTGSEKTGKS